MKFKTKILIVATTLTAISFGFYWDILNVHKKEKKIIASNTKVSKPTPDPNPLKEHTYGLVKMYIREGHLHKGDHVRVGFTNYDAINGAFIYAELRRGNELIDIQREELGSYQNQNLIFKELKQSGEYHLDIRIQLEGTTAQYREKSFQNVRYKGIIVD